MSTRWAFGAMLLAACQQPAPEPVNDAPDNIQADAPANAPERAAAAAIKAPIDETSVQAAGQLVERYAELLEKRRFAGALALWGDNGVSEAEFVASFEKYATISASVGPPGEMEGAAGSIYVDVPLTLSGALKSGGRFKLAGMVTLRRANNVPGSTAEQRRWHIYSASGLEPRN